jgi:hypothetical protein
LEKIPRRGKTVVPQEPVADQVVAEVVFPQIFMKISQNQEEILLTVLYTNVFFFHGSCEESAKNHILVANSWTS